MTAICGMVGRHEAPAGGVDAMLAAMTHHGADVASWTDAGVGLGRRCAAGDGVGPRGAPAPGPDVPGTVVVADARLDDRDTLCGALGLPPAARAAHDDRALIAKAYRRWGADSPRHLLGDYAFAVWDAAKRTLFCARDHAGVRPFYYAETRRGLVFASAIEAVLAGPDVGRELDEFTVGMWLMRRDAALPATSTFFQAVRRLPPGHGLVVTNGAVRLQRHWRPEDVPRAAPASDDDYAEEFLALYSRAVKDRLCGPGRIGVHLSGGLDSSSVAVLAARELRRQGRPPPPAFTWLPPLGEEPPGEGGEREYDAVGAVAGQEGLQVFLQPPTAADTLALLRCDGAFPQAHVGPNEAAVQRAAAAHGVRVLLSGLGGDQGISFNGYGYYAGLLLGGRWTALFAEARARGSNPLRLAAGTALRVLPHGYKLLIPRNRLRKWLQGDPEPRARRFINRAFARERPFPPRTRRWPTSARRGQLESLGRRGLGEHLERWAASGVRHGLEYRYPLLDRRVLELALSLPPEQFRRGPSSRWLMRHALALDAVLPPEVCWHESKSDPARFDAASGAFLGALPSIRRELAARAVPPSRARYVDMPRLVERLEDPALSRRRRSWSGIGRTLSFLDF